MKSLEAIKRDNLRDHPYERVSIRDFQEEILQCRDQAESAIELVIMRAIYKAQLEIFQHFGKTSNAYHEYLEQRKK